MYPTIVGGSTPRRVRRAAFALFAATALLATACAEDEPASTTAAPSGESTTTAGGDTTSTTAGDDMASEMPAIEIVASDYAFEIDDEVPAGFVQVSMRNDGEEAHHAQIVRLNDDVTMEDLNAALQSGDEAAALALVTLVGGPSVADPGITSTAIVELEEGSHALLCFLPDAEGLPHLAHGMVQPFEVTGDPVVTEAPASDGDIVLDDYTIELPDGFTGEGTFRVVNEGEEPHEVVLLRINDDKTMADVAAWAEAPEGPPPFAYVGGMQGIMPGGGEGYLPLDLEDGDYVAICAIPDADGTPHVDLGMLAPFSVGDADDVDDGVDDDADDTDDGEEPDEG